MTIQWGPWETAPSGGGTSGMRVGLEASFSAVTNGSTTVTMTVKVWTENWLTYLGDSQSINYSGTPTAGWGTFNFTNSQGTDPVLRTTETYVYTYPVGSYGSSPGGLPVTATMSGVFDGTTASASETFTVPARPYAAPSAPTGVTAVRNTDAQGTLTWTRNATSAKPYTSQSIQMRTYTGTSWSSWSTIATVSATATSYAKTGLSANRAYEFQIRANNSVGSSGYNDSNTIFMTPAAPTLVTAGLSGTGTQIVLSWTKNHYSSPYNSVTIQRSVAGGAYANVATGLLETATTWTDTSPGAGTNAYRVTVVNSFGVTSAVGQSNTVSTSVPSLAPTLLSPNGVAVDFDRDVTLRWQHNPGADGAPQTARFIDYSNDGGANWIAVATGGSSSTVPFFTIVGGTLTNGVTRLWRVRTRGVTAAGVGPNSASATLIGSATPAAGITAPTASTVVLPFTTTWTYSQAQGSPQAEWQAQLFAADGVTLLQALSGEDGAAGATFSYPVANGTSYVVKVRVKSGAGLWSDWASVTTAVALLPPAGVDLVAEFQHTTGTTVLSLASQAPVAGVTLPVDSVTIDRRVEGGDWVTLYVGLWVPNDVLDPLPSLTSLTEYRVTSVSSSPSYFVNPVVQVLPPEPISAGPDHQWVFLNYGDSFEKVLRFRGEPKVAVTTGRQKNTQNFLGRQKPVLLLGENRGREVSAAGTLVFDQLGAGDDAALWDSPPLDWEDAGQEAEVVCFRDFMGRRVFGSLSDVEAGAESPGKGSVSFSVTEVDYAEQYGLFEDVAIYPNLLDGDTADFEGGTVGDWTNSYFGTPGAVTITSDATRALDGTKSMKVVYPTAVAGAGPQLPMECDPTKTYVARIRVWVPTGVPAVRFADPYGATTSVDSTVTNAWQTLTITWTGKSVVYLVPRSAGATTAGQAFWLDTAMVYTR